MQNREMNLNFNFEYKMYEPIMKFISENDFDSYPVIKLFYLALKLDKNNDSEERYYEFKKYLLTHVEFVDLEDKKLMFTELFNYAIDRYHKEKSGFDEEAFDIMNMQLKHETYPSRSIRIHGLCILP